MMKESLSDDDDDDDNNSFFSGVSGRCVGGHMGGFKDFVRNFFSPPKKN